MTTTSTIAPVQVPLLAPVSGVLVPIETIPDEAFASGLVGRGISIDPTSDTLVAPCAGRVSFVHPAGHALTIATPEGADVLLHIGLETVGLRGEGFDILATAGQDVAAGQPLVRFDLAILAARAKSLLTQLVVANSDVLIDLVPATGLVMAGADAACVLVLPGRDAEAPRADAAPAPAASAPAGDTVTSDDLVVPNPSGFHARPAALLAEVADRYTAEIELIKGDQVADAKSMIEILTLGAQRGDAVRVRALGPDAAEAVAGVTAAIRDGLGEATI